MRYVSVKSADKIKLAGISAELEVVDNSVKGILLRDSNGGVLRCCVQNFNEFHAQVPAPPKTEKKFVLKGTIRGVPISEQIFDSEYDAMSKRGEINGSGDYDADLVIEERELVVAE